MAPATWGPAPASRPHQSVWTEGPGTLKIRRHHDNSRGAFYLPYNLLLLAVEHHDEDQADHVLVGQALLPPEDGVEQVLLEDLLGRGEGGAGPTGGRCGEALAPPSLLLSVVSGSSASLGVVQLFISDLHPGSAPDNSLPADTLYSRPLLVELLLAVDLHPGPVAEDEDQSGGLDILQKKLFQSQQQMIVIQFVIMGLVTSDRLISNDMVIVVTFK